MVVVAVIDLNTGSSIASMFEATEQNNSLKLSYFEFYNGVFSEPGVFLFGQGLNAKEWSQTVFQILDNNASKTELTYLELIRVFGLVGFIVFIFLFIGMFNRLKFFSIQGQWLSPALFVYLLVAAVNPYIFSSNGMLLIGYISALGNKKREALDVKSKDLI